MSDEHREPAQHHAFDLRQEAVAPIQRGLQGFLARRRGAWPNPQQGQALVQQRSGLLQPIGLDASSRQLDGERHTVELSADAHHDGGVGVVQVQASTARHRALHEQPGRGELLKRRRGELRIIRGTSQRIQFVDVLAFDLQRLAACCQDVDLRRGCDDACRQGCHRFDQVLAGVEHQKNPLVAQIGDQVGSCVVGLHRQAEHGGYSRGHQFGIAQHSKIDEQHGARESFGQVMSDRDRNGGLAHAARAHDRDKASGGQLSRQSEHVVVASDHSHRATGQVAVRKSIDDSRFDIVAIARPRDRCHEAVAPPGQGRDVASAVLSIAQRPAQAGDLKAQAAFFHGDVGPDPSQQVFLADGLVGTGHQGKQDVERPRAQFHGAAVFRQKSFARD